MHPIVRSVVGVIVGIVVGSGLVYAIEWPGHLIHPLPEGVDPWDPSSRPALEAHAANAPPAVFLLALLAIAVGTSGGAWLAAKVAGRAPIVHGLVVGLWFLLASAMNLTMIPHPVWFAVINLVLVLPAAYAGGKLA
jgi:hypothetical protein